VLLSGAGSIEASSFHVEIPLRDGFERRIDQAIQYKVKQHKFCPDTARAGRGACGAYGISGDGRIVHGVVNTYLLREGRVVRGSMRHVSEDGLRNLSKPMAMMNSNGRTFRIMEIPAGSYEQAALPKAIVAEDPGKVPEDAAFVVGRAMASDGSFVVGEYRLEGKAILAPRKKADGTIEGGYAGGRKSLTTSEAFLWSAETGYEFFDRPKGWRPDGHYSAFGLSKDGNTVLATIYDMQPPWNHQRPVVIDRRNNRVTALDHVFESDHTSTEAELISGDGLTVVGRAWAKGQKFRLFRWTQSGGYEDLEIPVDNAHWRLIDVSFDGSIVVGSFEDFDEQGIRRSAAAIWVDGEFQRLSEYLEARGLDLQGWDITHATQISDDGLVIGGQANGVNVTGVPWFAYLGEEALGFPSPPADISLQQVRDWTLPYGEVMTAGVMPTPAAEPPAAKDEQTEIAPEPPVPAKPEEPPQVVRPAAEPRQAHAPGRLNLANASFEAPRTSSYQFGVDSWLGNQHGIVVPPPAMFPSGIAPSGRQLAFLSRAGSWMSQETAIEPMPNWQYTVQLYAGNRLEPGFNAGQFVVRLEVGNTVVASKEFATSTKGEFTAVSVVYDAPTSPPAGKLKVYVSNVNARQINVDSVRLYGYSIASAEKPPSLAWENQPPNAPAVAGSSSPPEWETVGFWDYDAVDGQHLSAGVVMIRQAGGGLNQRWAQHLQLRNHSQLRQRPRSLWPVELSRKDKRVCINFPGYPSYTAFVDLPDDAYDGVYRFGPCEGR